MMPRSNLPEGFKGVELCEHRHNPLFGRCPACENATLRADLSAAEQKIDDWKSATLLVGASGDPADIEPPHLESEITTLRAELERVTRERDEAKQEWDALVDYTDAAKADLIAEANEERTKREAAEGAELRTLRSAYRDGFADGAMFYAFEMPSPDDLENEEPDAFEARAGEWSAAKGEGEDGDEG